MFRYVIATLGCKVNQYETQAMETLLSQRGFEPVTDNADVIIVNTCAVTAMAGHKSRQLIRQLKSRHPGALVAVCGCYSQLEPDQVQSLGADIIFGSADKEKFIEAVAARFPSRQIDNPFDRRVIEQLPVGSLSGRTRALMRIQDGCDNFCTYCIIPYTRGRVRSQPMEDAVKQAVQLQERGYKEIVVTGIEIASYGKDLPGKPGLAAVVSAIADAAPETRIHLGSLEPTVITEQFCRELAACGNICRHFHLSLQSGCDATLKRMRRKYDSARFYESCELLRRYFPDCSLTADVITGFPGETEEEFSQSLAFMEKCAFSYVHCFPYSVRPGTPAEKMPDQVPNAEKENRVKRAMELVNRMQREYLQQWVGKTLPVLFETEQEGHADNYCLVHTGQPQKRGFVQKVQITAAEEDRLIGFVI